MKIIAFTGLLALLCFPAVSQTKAQLKDKEEIEKRILKDDSEKFGRSDFPEKWKDESAVILYQKYVFTGEKKSSTIYEWHGWFHRRIKILDKAAVDKFSELLFLQSSYNDKDFFGIGIVKSDGSIVKVDPTQGITVKGSELDEDPSAESALMYYESSASFVKIALPSIEVGDIIDYYCYNNDKTYGQIFATSSIPGLWLADDYPIVGQCIEYHLNSDLSYNLKSVNGAPEIETESPGLNIKGEPDAETIMYFINDSMREKISEEKFLIYNRVIPQIKVDIGTIKNAYYSKYYSGHIFCAPESGTNYTVKPIDIKEYFNKMEDPHIVDQVLEMKIKGILSKKCPECGPIEQAKYVFYKARNTNTENYDGVYRIMMMTRVLSKLKIDHQILAIIPKYVGSVENVMKPYDLIPAICVKGADGEELFLFAPLNTRNVNEYNYQIDGADAFVYFPKKIYKINPANKNRMPEMRKMPQSVSTDNVLNTVMNATFDEENDLVKVNTEVQITGFQKRQIVDAILYGYDNTYEEENFLGHSNSTSFMTEQNLRSQEERRANKLKIRDEYLSDLLKEEYELDTLLGTKIINSSLFNDPQLRYSQEFSIKNMYAKAGKNIILDLGKLIGYQISLKEKDLNRINDIYYSYPCIYSYDITVALPDGYNAEKFDAFNVSIDNSCMSLQSQVTSDANQLHFTFRKEYKNGFDTKDKWPEYVEVLEAAYKITQQKLVLKPIQ